MEVDFLNVHLKLILSIDISRTSFEVGPKWVPHFHTDYKSVLVQLWLGAVRHINISPVTIHKADRCLCQILKIYAFSIYL